MSLEVYLAKCSAMFHGLGYEATRKLAYDFAKKLKKSIPKNWEDKGMAGIDWMYGFMTRHQTLSLRSPESTSIARARGFNRVAVMEFFALWSSVLEKSNIGPDSIYNLDETGLSTVQGVPKVIAVKGTKQVGQISATERGSLVTACCCVSAIGRALPPVLIFPRVNYKDWMSTGAPPGTLGLATSSGWMNSELFITVMAHFIKNMQCSLEKPAVLFMDNHESHLSLEVVDMARENGLTIVTFPPHCSHRLQPLDVSVYGPFKTYYRKSVDEWNLSNPGQRISIYNLPTCFSYGFNRAFSYENIAAGFRKSGIFPLNSEIFCEEDFLPARVFESSNIEQGKPTQEYFTCILFMEGKMM